MSSILTLTAAETYTTSTGCQSIAAMRVSRFACYFYITRNCSVFAYESKTFFPQCWFPMKAARRLYSSGSIISTVASLVIGGLIPFFRKVSLLRNSLEDLPMSFNMTEAELFLPLLSGPAGVPMLERRFRTEPKRLLVRFSRSSTTIAALCIGQIHRTGSKIVNGCGRSQAYLSPTVLLGIANRCLLLYLIQVRAKVDGVPLVSGAREDTHVVLVLWLRRNASVVTRFSVFLGFL